MNGYRLALGSLIAVCFTIQTLVWTRLTGQSRVLAGYGLTLVFFVALAEFATMAIGRRMTAGRLVGSSRPLRVRTVLLLGSLLLVLNLCAKALSPYLPLWYRRPPFLPACIIVAFWLAIVVRARRPAAAVPACVAGLLGLVLGTRILALLVMPYDRRISDMLPIIDRALDELLSGRFPYINFPPAMPYPPVLFLAYLPAKLLGVDLRVTNLVLDVLTAALALGIRTDAGNGRGSRPAITAEQVALPLFMLLPTWVHYSVGTHFAPCVLTAVLLGRFMGTARPRWQAVALALAVGSNQMLAAAGPIVLACWVRRHGARRAAGLLAQTAGLFLAIVAPFLLWKPGPFLAITLDRRMLPPAHLAGRLTVLPLFLGRLPHASQVLTAIVVSAAAAAAWRARRPEGAVAALALGLFAALLVQPVSFAHYFLPALALAALAGAGGGSPRPQIHPHPHPRRPNAVSPEEVTT
jgi:hypothetical protein